MLRVGIIGFGGMGQVHFDRYRRLVTEGYPIKLVSICDIDEAKLRGTDAVGDVGATVKPGQHDLSSYSLYTDMDDMLKNEQLDFVDIALPTYLHAEASIKAMEAGFHVLCEKPMALDSRQCLEMIAASQRTGRTLMIAHCLRFWPEYEYLKAAVDDGRYGRVTSAYLFRGGFTPRWSYQNWLLQKDKSGGCLLDQHIHDIDTINWILGKPDKVSTVASNVIEGSGYDMVSTNYIYSDGKVVNAQDDWTLNGDFGFQMEFRVNFERGNMVYRDGKLKVNPESGPGFEPELPKEDAYTREIKYFVSRLIAGEPIEIAPPTSSADTIKIAEAEVESAKRGGVPVRVE